jgi:hypothetical protein
LKRKIVLPWRYLAMLALGLVVLWLLLARFGRSAPVLFGWLVGWLVISRGVEFVMRRKNAPPPRSGGGGPRAEERVVEGASRERDDTDGVSR